MVKNLLLNFKTKYTLDDKLLFIMVISLMLPYVLSLVVISGIAFYVIIKKNIKKLTHRMRSSYFLFAFAFYLIINSVINANWVGLTTSIVMLLIFINVIYYRNFIHKKLFENIIDAIIVLSIVAAIYSFLEQMYYVNTVTSIINYFGIYNDPKYRVSSFFLNANYYAMMILLVEACCIYKLLTNKKNAKWYIFAIIFNIFPLYLTGSRMAWVCIVLTWLIMFIGARKYFALFITIIFTLIICICLYFRIPIIPRFMEIDIFDDRRIQIYENTFLMIKDNWLFGKGPFTYLLDNHLYINEFIATYGKTAMPNSPLGLSAWHAHSALLDPIISYGLIGCLLLWTYLYANFRRIFYVLSNRLDRALATLLVGVLVAVISANILDYSIFWLQTGTLFLIILGSFDIYRKQILLISKDYSNIKNK
jgi:hypothetical protein